MAIKIDEKSMKNRGWIADAFLDRFGMALGCQMVDFGSQNLQNIIKMATKIAPKSMKIQACVADAFLECFWGAKVGNPSNSTGPLWRTFSTKTGKNGIQEGIHKSMPKKYWKLIAKGSQNDAKIDAKIDEKTMRFRNLRFLDFYKEYNVEIVFLHDQACRKSIKIRS